MPLTLPSSWATAGVSPDLAHKIWDREEVRHRFAEAASTLRRLPLPRYGKPSELRTHWPDVAHDWLAYADISTHLARIPPTPLEISRMDEVLDWLHLLTRDQRLIIWGRANHWSWPKLVELDELEQNGKGRGQRQLKNILDDGEHRILAHLNGTPHRMVLR